MRRSITQDSSYYESLSDISMATLGIFIIFFVINLIFINSDVITQAVKNKKLDQDIISTRQELEDFKLEEARQIADFKKQNESQIQEIEIQIESLRSLSNNLERSINNAQEKIKKALNVDRVISVEEIRTILQEVKLKRRKVENESKQIKLKSNHVRQEYNKYVEAYNEDGMNPYLLLDVDRAGNILLRGKIISERNFR
ncbi:uncharacterized protein METZ01_LOCUS453878, partial [marine metagenome]